MTKTIDTFETYKTSANAIINFTGLLVKFLKDKDLISESDLKDFDVDYINKHINDMEFVYAESELVKSLEENKELIKEVLSHNG